MKKPGITLFGVGLMAALLAGCASTQTKSPKFPDNTSPPGSSSPAASNPALPGQVAITITNQLDPVLLQPQSSPFILGPGDQLDIEITGNAASRSTVVVGMDGKIYFSLLPGVDVMGMTLEQARERLESELSQFVIHSKVSLSLRLVASKHVWLVGRIARPGIYPLTGPTTLLEALAMAGGTATAPSSVSEVDLSDLRHSFVMRQGKVLPVNFSSLLREGDMSQNIYLQPDDFVFIPSSLSQEVYVLGSVRTPSAVPYADPMTVISAIAGANGPADNAYLNHVAIVRGSLSQPQLIEVNYKDVTHGKAPNILLEPGDIVYVPLSPYRYLKDYVQLIVNSFALSWSANMGSRAVLGTSVGVSVPVSPTSH
jgi:polysaccharide export outer membrane protein